MANTTIITTICALAAGLITACSAQQPQDTRIIYGPETMAPQYRLKIDSIVQNAIQSQAMPGCRIMAVHQHRVILNQSYGHLSYDSLQPVTDSTLYDLASVTKMAASSLLIMELYDQGRLNLDTTIASYFPGLPKNGATLREALAHQAGFKPWLDLRRRLSRASDANIDSAARIMDPALRDTVLSIIQREPMLEPGTYQYSDLGFYLYPQWARKYFRMDFSDFLDAAFYRPLGISPTFRPLEKYPISRIAPTENDTIWRNRIIRGTVHDEGAHLMGGISGHAGLFGTANDMAVIMQMLLNGGIYGKVRFLKPETVELFTQQAFNDNRRGLVFDKPLLDTTLNGTPSKMAGKRSFGHTGFTGTFVWADPDCDLILVFLCNSTYPCRSTMLSKLNVRTQIHDVVYQAIMNKRVDE